MNVTYLLGAGASFGTKDPNPHAYEKDGSDAFEILRSLPVVNELPKWIRQAGSYLFSTYMGFSNSKLDAAKLDWENSPLNHYEVDKNKHGDVKKMMISIWELATECDRHQSVDTFFRKLYLTKDFKRIKEFKATLSVCFDVWHYASAKDKRYDSFFSSLLEDKPLGLTLPDNIKVVSWNYDRQFEAAHGYYLGGSFDPTSSYPFGSYTGERNPPTNPILMKLNGSAGYYPKHSNGVEMFWPPYEEETRDIKSIKTLANNWKLGAFRGHDTDCALNFAWEEDINQTTFQQARAAFNSADVLIIIGYTFPFFNRKIDAQLIDELLNGYILRRESNSQRLLKIIIQDPSAEDVKQNLLALVEGKSLKYVDLETRTNVRQFYIPSQI